MEAPAASLNDKLNEAEEVADVTPRKAVEILEAVIASEGTSEDDLRVRELAIYKLGEILAKLGFATTSTSTSTSTSFPFS